MWFASASSSAASRAPSYAWPSISVASAAASALAMMAAILVSQSPGSALRWATRGGSSATAQPSSGPLEGRQPFPHGARGVERDRFLLGREVPIQDRRLQAVDERQPPPQAAGAAGQSLVGPGLRPEL